MAGNSFGLHTSPPRPAPWARCASRSTCASTSRANPMCSRSAPSRLVSTETPTRVQDCKPGSCVWACAAARIMAAPPELWMVSSTGDSAATDRTAPATVFGMSWSFRSRKTGNPRSSTRRTPSGPRATKNSRPNFTPPTWGAIRLAKSSAASASGVSRAQKTGLGDGMDMGRQAFQGRDHLPRD